MKPQGPGCKEGFQRVSSKGTPREQAPKGSLRVRVSFWPSSLRVTIPFSRDEGSQALQGRLGPKASKGQAAQGSGSLRAQGSKVFQGPQVTLQEGLQGPRANRCSGASQKGHVDQALYILSSQASGIVVRSYHQDYRRSHQNSQLKPAWAGSVLG